MGNKENSSATTNASGSNKSNRKRPFYRNIMSTSDGNNAKPTVAVRELKFHLHDSAKRKHSESFGKIKEAIVLKIQKSFDDPIAIAESISGNAKKLFKKTELQKSELDDPVMKAMENTLFMEEWKIDFTIYRSECKKYHEAWVKAYLVIWDTYFSRDV